MHGPELLFRAERGTARIDRVHQRIALIDRLDTPATEILDLERKDDEQPVDPTPDFFHARLLPCPDFRRDVVIGRYAALAAETGQTKVETGIVDQHEHVGSVGRHVALAPVSYTHLGHDDRSRRNGRRSRSAGRLRAGRNGGQYEQRAKQVFHIHALL